MFNIFVGLFMKLGELSIGQCCMGAAYEPKIPSELLNDITI